MSLHLINSPMQQTCQQNVKSSGKWSKLGQFQAQARKNQKIKKVFYSSKILTFKNFCILSQDPKNIESSSKVTFYVLNNNFFYTKAASFYVAENTDAFFLFLLQ